MEPIGQPINSTYCKKPSKECAISLLFLKIITTSAISSSILLYGLTVQSNLKKFYQIILLTLPPTFSLCISAIFFSILAYKKRSLQKQYLIFENKTSSKENFEESNIIFSEENESDSEERELDPKENSEKEIILESEIPDTELDFEEEAFEEKKEEVFNVNKKRAYIAKNLFPEETTEALQNLFKNFEEKSEDDDEAFELNLEEEGELDLEKEEKYKIKEERAYIAKNLFPEETTEALQNLFKNFEEKSEDEEEAFELNLEEEIIQEPDSPEIELNFEEEGELELETKAIMQEPIFPHVMDDLDFDDENISSIKESEFEGEEEIEIPTFAELKETQLNAEYMIKMPSYLFNKKVNTTTKGLVICLVENSQIGKRGFFGLKSYILKNLVSFYFIGTTLKTMNPLVLLEFALTSDNTKDLIKKTQDNWLNDKGLLKWMLSIIGIIAKLLSKIGVQINLDGILKTEDHVNDLLDYYVGNTVILPYIDDFVEGIKGHCNDDLNADVIRRFVTRREWRNFMNYLI